MRYAERHLRVARLLAKRNEGVTARELADRSKISERLAKTVLDDLVEEDGFSHQERGVTHVRGAYRNLVRKRGPRPKAVVAA